jgi:iron complex transport system ATP-binding protein
LAHLSNTAHFNMTLLEFDGVSVKRDKTLALDEVSLALRSGEFVGLLGPNGAGKSTLLSTPLGIMRYSGNIQLGGRSLEALTPNQRARFVTYVAQDREIAWPISVETVVQLGRLPYQGLLANTSDVDRSAVEEAMARMNLSALRYRSVLSLSGGERARVLVARALAQQTPVLLADEPAAGLDPAHQIALMGVFREYALQGRAVLISIHDLTLAAQWCSRIVIMTSARIIADGCPDEVLTQEILEKTFGVEVIVIKADSGLIVAPTGLARQLDLRQ